MAILPFPSGAERNDQRGCYTVRRDVPDRRKSRTESAMMKGEKYVAVDGIRTRYFEKGEGPILVLFHGGHFGSHDAADSADDSG